MHAPKKYPRNVPISLTPQVSSLISDCVQSGMPVRIRYRSVHVPRPPSVATPKTPDGTPVTDSA
eukprot:5702867-Prymnesium_polylepis.1